MRHAAETGRGKHQPARLRLGERDKLDQRPGRHALANDQDLRHGGDLGEQPEVGERSERPQVHVDGERAEGGDADGMAVGIGLGAPAGNGTTSLMGRFGNASPIDAKGEVRRRARRHTRRTGGSIKRQVWRNCATPTGMGGSGD